MTTRDKERRLTADVLRNLYEVGIMTPHRSAISAGDNNGRINDPFTCAICKDSFHNLNISKNV